MFSILSWKMAPCSSSPAGVGRHYRRRDSGVAWVARGVVGPVAPEPTLATPAINHSTRTHTRTRTRTLIL